MLKFIVAILLTALLSFVCGLYLPWWGVAVAAFVVSTLIRQKPGMAFLSGFAGVFLLWALLTWWIDARNNSILSKKIALVLPLGGSVLALVLLTAFIGALVAGFGALTGTYLRKMVLSPDKTPAE